MRVQTQDIKFVLQNLFFSKLHTKKLNSNEETIVKLTLTTRPLKTLVK